MTLPTKNVSTFQCSYDLKYARIRRKMNNTEQIKFEKEKTKIIVKLQNFWRIFKQSFLPVLVPVTLYTHIHISLFFFSLAILKNAKTEMCVHWTDIHVFHTWKLKTKTLHCIFHCTGTVSIFSCTHIFTMKCWRIHFSVPIFISNNMCNMQAMCNVKKNWCCS